ncbi:hypothetical protein CFP56_015987 [Quercus suber]|uniref:Uncharacterized protein n=1 Tax=Quercus suber TaxID=58331 RepID=A0AAW0KQX9_QUESU
MKTQHARIHLRCTSLHQTAMMLNGIRQVAMNQSDLWMTELAESAEHDLDMEDNPITDISRQMRYDTKGFKKNQSSSSKLSLAPLDRTLVKGKEAGEIHSISCKRPEESGPKAHWPTGTKFPSIGSKRVGAMHLSPSSEKRCVMLYVTIAIIGLQMITRTGSKLIHPTISVARELTKDQPILLGSENNVKILSKISLTGKTTEWGAQTSVNSKTCAFEHGNLKTILVERNKLCFIKVGKRTPDLSSIKTSRITEANKVLSNSVSQREINSLEKSVQKMEVQGNIALKIEHRVDSTENEMSQSPSLKRKTFEASNADSVYLNPLKHLSASSSLHSWDLGRESSAKHVFTDHRTSNLNVFER